MSRSSKSSLPGADSPVLPVDEMERLHKLNPDYARSFIDQAEKESRRAFINKLLRQVCAFLICLAGVTGGCLVIYTNPGYPDAGAFVATVSIVMLVIAFVGVRNK